MDIFTLIKSRRSIRRYKDKPVPKKLVAQVVEAGIWAPSSMNRQPWRFVVVTGQEEREFFSAEAKVKLMDFINSPEGKKHWPKDVRDRFGKRAKSKDDMIFYKAPVIIFIIRTIDVGDEFDYGLATENMMLCAHGLGLGTCPIGLSQFLDDSKKAREKIGMKSNEKLILSLVLGYPDEKPSPSRRDFSVISFIE